MRSSRIRRTSGAVAVHDDEALNRA